MRYQFYREHKYVSAALNDLERLIAKTDFRNTQETMIVKETYLELMEMLKAHAFYENDRLHGLLKRKHSNIHEHAEADHAQQEEQLFEIQRLIEAILNASSDEEKLGLGYRLYLTYRKFVADNLIHLHEEETIILPELQRLYTDEELKQVEAETYCAMTSEDLAYMMRTLFPHMNSSDRIAFLADIQEVQPKKFIAAWHSIESTFNQKERADLIQRFRISI